MYMFGSVQDGPMVTFPNYINENEETQVSCSVRFGLSDTRDAVEKINVSLLCMGDGAHWHTACNSHGHHIEVHIGWHWKFKLVIMSTLTSLEASYVAIAITFGATSDVTAMTTPGLASDYESDNLQSDVLVHEPGSIVPAGTHIQCNLCAKMSSQITEEPTGCQPPGLPRTLFV